MLDAAGDGAEPSILEEVDTIHRPGEARPEPIGAGMTTYAPR